MPRCLVGQKCHQSLAGCRTINRLANFWRLKVIPTFLGGGAVVEFTRPFSVSWRVLCRRCPLLGHGLSANHESDVRAAVVVSPEPLRGVILSLPLAVRLDAFDDVLIEPLMPVRAVVALDLGVLLGLTGLDMLDGNPMTRSPFHPLPGRRCWHPLPSRGLSKCARRNRLICRLCIESGAGLSDNELD